MTPVAAPPLPNAMPLRYFMPWKCTVDQYHHMIQAGILTANDPVELLEGWIVKKMPRSPRHDAVIDQAREVIHSRLPAGWRVRVQSAITTGDSEPEPDLAVVAGPASRYLDHHPGPSDIALLVEAADSSLLGDRQEKARVYARASIVGYWIINLVDQQVEVYTQPSGPTASPSYAQRQDFGLGDTVPLVIGGQEVGQISVRELFAAP